MKNGHTLFRPVSFGLCGLVLGLSFGVGSSLLAQTVEEQVLLDPKVEVVPKEFSLSLDIAKKATAIMASTSLDIMTATEMAKEQFTLEPQHRELLKKLDVIIELLVDISRKMK